MISMNKKELFKQADYTFQRGNRELAKKYLADFLDQYPNEESAWMLMARMVEKNEHKIECYERALKINPGNNEAKIWIARIKFPGKTLPRYNTVNQFEMPRPFKNLLHWVSVFAVLAILLSGASYAVAWHNPESAVAKLLVIATPTQYAQIPITGDIALQTRAKMSENYPQYAPLVDALIGFAVDSANSGLDGAPERPGAKILPSDGAGIEAKATLENALPQPGSLSSATLTERQLTSWLAMEMKNNPDLPLSDVQVFLRDDKIQIWGMVIGSTDSTSALIVGNLGIDLNKNPSITIESVQIGTRMIPGVLVSQMETWLNQMLAEEINQQAPGLQVMNINLTNGLVTVSGMR
jgi:tetratricopeptide (TPR) repeat protein